MLHAGRVIRPYCVPTPRSSGMISAGSLSILTLRRSSAAHGSGSKPCANGHSWDGNKVNGEEGTMNLKLRQWILSADLLWIVMSVGLVQLLQNGRTPEPGLVASPIAGAYAHKAAGGHCRQRQSCAPTPS